MVSDGILAQWQCGPVQVWQLAHQPGTRGEPGARQVLGLALGMAASEVPIVRSERGRPELVAPLAHCDAGWSHSGGHLLVALARGGRLGVDLERVQVRPRMDEVIARFFHPAEVDWLLGLPADQRSHWFFRVWCAKEAILKCHGHGISYGLHRFAVMPEAGALQVADSDTGLGPASSWQLHEWEIGTFRAAVAWQPG